MNILQEHLSLLNSFYACILWCLLLQVRLRIFLLFPLKYQLKNKYFWLIATFKAIRKWMLRSINGCNSWQYILLQVFKNQHVIMMRYDQFWDISHSNFLVRQHSLMLGLKLPFFCLVLFCVVFFLYFPITSGQDIHRPELSQEDATNESSNY